VTFTVAFTPEAEGRLIELYRFIAEAESAQVAARYAEAIVAFARSWRLSPCG